MRVRPKRRRSRKRWERKEEKKEREKTENRPNLDENDSTPSLKPPSHQSLQACKPFSEVEVLKDPSSFHTLFKNEKRTSQLIKVSLLFMKTMVSTSTNPSFLILYIILITLLRDVYWVTERRSESPASWILRTPTRKSLPTNRTIS